MLGNRVYMAPFIVQRFVGWFAYNARQRDKTDLSRARRNFVVHCYVHTHISRGQYCDEFIFKESQIDNPSFHLWERLIPTKANQCHWLYLTLDPQHVTTWIELQSFRRSQRCRIKLVPLLT